MTEIKENIKGLLQQMMQEQLESQLKSLIQAKSSIAESKLNETKSSAGDKYETGRAMIQMEQDKISSQLDQLMATKNHLKQISSDLKSHIVKVGTLVITDIGNYYVSVSIGKMIVDDIVYYAISPAAPLSKVLTGKGVGDNVLFRNRCYKILDIL